LIRKRPAYPVGAALAAKNPTRWMAPATPVFAAEAAPTGTARAQSLRRTFGSGRAREAGDAEEWHRLRRRWAAQQPR
ncbi:hypothetical protein EFK07_27615, partial [Pseudomonas putida]